MRQGDTGADVRQLQILLQRAGLAIEPDGWYGPATETAVRAFQKRVGLVEDGVAGQKTLQLLTTGNADPRLLRQGDLATAAMRLGVDVASIMAINAVETRGSGFLPDGRPVILYERHVMYQRLVKAGLPAADLAARYPDLINPKRGGYVGGEGEYDRLQAAMAIHPASAQEACSWGQYQVMGYHWETLGYSGIDAFVAAMQASEAAQLEAFCRFILANPPILKALRARQWDTLARLYNGPDYRENLYDVKLQRAYARFAGASA